MCIVRAIDRHPSATSRWTTSIGSWVAAKATLATCLAPASCETVITPAFQLRQTEDGDTRNIGVVIRRVWDSDIDCVHLGT
jgi:hypothetical protein